MNLLMVDDDAHVLESIQKRVKWERLGIDHVYKASYVSAAKIILRECRIDLLLCDIEMPQESGLDLLAWIREKKMNIQVMMLTSYAEFDYAQRALSLECLEYFLKPVDYEKLEKGPVTVSRLHLLLERNLITPDTEVRSEQGGYAPIKSIRQLRWQLLMEGNSYLEPVACALTVLDIISSILNRHSSYAAEGILKTPIPRAKRVFGQRKYLAYIAQLMLVNNPTLVENAADMIRIITENNEDAMSKLYLTGVFFFAMAYSGSNFLKISSMLYSTHLLQHFNTSSETLTAELPISKRSILGTILPESMICLLDNYGPEEFTKKLLGNFDTPEVIWKYEMRKHMVEEVLKHIGDFGKKLRENPMMLFDYGPIPLVKYPELEEEMWCHNYYIAALCDEKRFNNWPIKKPVELLRAKDLQFLVGNKIFAPQSLLAYLTATATVGNKISALEEQTNKDRE